MKVFAIIIMFLAIAILWVVAHVLYKPIYDKISQQYVINKDDFKLAIVNRHHLIMKITGKGAGYNKILKRHPGFIDGQKPIFFDGKTRRCTILEGIIKKENKTTSVVEEIENMDF